MRAGRSGKQSLLTCRVLLALLLGSTAVSAEPAASPEPAAASAEPVAPPPSAPTLALQRHTLSNGLRVVLNEDHSTPSVAICVSYGVGSRDDTEGQSGIAHLVEHLMFQGSRNVDRTAHVTSIERAGGRTGSRTTKELTSFWEVLPRSQLELGLWLEADRMKGLAFSRDALAAQRAVIREEALERHESRVFGRGAPRLAQIALQGSWAYQHSTFGDAAELDALDADAVRGFHRAFYAPNNAVIGVSGDFDPATVLAFIEQHFGDARPNPNPAEPAPLAAVARQSSERLSVMVDEAARSPALFVGFVVPPRGTRERRALELAARILADGEGSRLHQSLVVEKASALRANVEIEHVLGPGLFRIELWVAPLSNVDTVQKWLDGELKRARLIGPSDEELARAKRRLWMDRVRRLERLETRAVELCESELAFGDAALVNDELDAYAAITKDEVRAAASAYLKDTQRSLVEVYPDGWVRDLGPVITTTTYVVAKGDTLIAIAKRHGTTTAAIAKQNGIDTKRPIHPGQRLLVTLGAGASTAPKSVTKKHVVKKGDTLIGIAKKYGTSASSVAKENRLSPKKPIFPGQELSITLEVSKGPGAAEAETPGGKAEASEKAKTPPGAKPAKAGTAPAAAKPNAKTPAAKSAKPVAKANASPSKPAPKPAPKKPAKPRAR